MIYYLNFQAAPLMLRVRKALDQREMPFQLRYIGQPDLGDKNRPTVVRSSLDIACSGMLIDFLNELGCRIEFEYSVKGNFTYFVLIRETKSCLK